MTVTTITNPTVCEQPSNAPAPAPLTPYVVPDGTWPDLNFLPHDVPVQVAVRVDRAEPTGWRVRRIDGQGRDAFVLAALVTILVLDDNVLRIVVPRHKYSSLRKTFTNDPPPRPLPFVRQISPLVLSSEGSAAA